MVGAKNDVCVHVSVLILAVGFKYINKILWFYMYVGAIPLGGSLHTSEKSTV